jgi:hypothetical protein
MSEPELIQERNISGKGVLKVPTDVVKNRYTVLYVTVFRPPTSEYKNFNYNPYRGRYGTIVFLRQGYVVDVRPIEYMKMAFDGVNDYAGQVLHAVKCAYIGTLQSYYNLGLALGAAPTTIDNAIAEYTNLRLAWDECRVVCNSNEAINLQLWRQKYDICDPDQEEDQPPPPPNPPPSPVPPGTPLDDISEPYDTDTNDDNNTQPFPGDDNTPPLPLQDCVVTYLYTNLFNGLNNGYKTVTLSNVRPPLTFLPVAYSLPSPNAGGGFLRSQLRWIDGDGAEGGQIIVNNTIAGHTITEISSPCENP